VVAMAQPKAQAPFLPGQKEAADLVPDEQECKLLSRAETDEHEQRGEASGTVVSGPGLVEAGKGMAMEVMEKLGGLHLPPDSLDGVKRTVETSLKGAFTTTKDAVQRTKQSLLDILPSPLSSSSATQAHQVVEDMEKDMLANSEGSGEDLSQIQSEAAAETAPQFMRAKL